MLSVDGGAAVLAHDLTEFRSIMALPEPAPPAREAAEALQLLRRRRNQLFPMLGFADPEWSMLLDLFVEQCRSRRTSVTSLSLASGVPPSTAMRFISAMVNQGVLNKCRDREDGRRVFVELSAGTMASMGNILGSLRAE